MSTTSLQYSIERNKETYAAVALPLVTAGIVAAPAVATVTGIGIYAITSIGPVERGLNSTIKFSLRVTGADPVSAESSAQVLTEGFKIYASGVGSSLASKFTAAGIRNTVAAKKDMLFGWFGKINRQDPVVNNKFTKRQIVEYLQNVDKVPIEQLYKDLQGLGLELYVPPQDGIYKFIHWRNDLRQVSSSAKPKLENSKFIIEVHKGKGGKDFDHMHITDAQGNVYDKHLNNLTAKFRKDNPGWHENKVQDKVEKLPEAHIKIGDFVELNMRPKNV